MPRALVIGASGQDGWFLAEQLRSQHYDVYGTRTPMSGKPVPPGIEAKWCNVMDSESVRAVVKDTWPDLVFNFASITTPAKTGWSIPNVFETNALGTLNVMRAVYDLAPSATVVNASSSAIYTPERYGHYGVTKVAAHQIVQGFRRDYGMKASNAVLYSHTSSRQSSDFLVRRIINVAARAGVGYDGTLVMTDLSATRAWGYAPDIVRAFPLIAAGTPGDYDVAGNTYSVRDVLHAAFDQVGISKSELSRFVIMSPTMVADEEPPGGVSAKHVGWEPQVDFLDAIRSIVDEEVRTLARG